MADQAQSGYYQAIAREFLRRRGAPFFLSPKDLAVISGWEEEGVPLDAVLEGIGRAFEAGRGPSRGRAPSTLARCQAQVRKAMAQHVDRGAGSRRKEARPRSEKAARARAEAQAWLGRMGAKDDTLEPLLRAALDLLGRPSPDEAALERIDEGVDQALWDRASRDEREALRRKMARELAGKSGPEAEAAVRTRFVKAAREAGKVPYVSLFYY
jgi:hypothetical protein